MIIKGIHIFKILKSNKTFPTATINVRYSTLPLKEIHFLKPKSLCGSLLAPPPQTPGYMT